MNYKKIFIRAGLILLSMMVITILLLMVAGTAMKYPSVTANINDWFYASRFFWLGWRLFIYAALGWGLWKIHKAPGFRDEYRQPLRRIMLVSVAYFLICEYTLARAMP